MINTIFGKKLGMTRYFLTDGESVPVTIVKVDPCVVIQKKTIDKDGYEAIQIGFEKQKENRLNKPLKGHFKKAGDKYFANLREIKVEKSEQFELGQEISADIFQVGESVNVSGNSKGRGFSGVIKRWGFGGGRKTHGSRSHRVPGSIGASATPARVRKGKKMPGRMGDQKVKVKNIQILDVRPDINVIALKGNLPGSRNAVIEISRI